MYVCMYVRTYLRFASPKKRRNKKGRWFSSVDLVRIIVMGIFRRGEEGWRESERASARMTGTFANMLITARLKRDALSRIKPMMWWPIAQAFYRLVFLRTAYLAARIISSWHIAPILDTIWQSDVHGFYIMNVARCCVFDRFDILMKWMICDT